MGIAYHDVTNHALKYAVYNQSPTSWSWDFQTIVSASTGGYDTGLATSLKFTCDGQPWIAYYSSTSSYAFLELASWVGSGGNCGEGPDLNKWKCENIDYGWNLGYYYASLDLDINDSPGIAYYDYDTGNLKFVTKYSQGNCGPLDSYKCVTIDASSADVGRFPSLAASRSFADPPRIAYYYRTNGKLKYAVGVLTGGNCGGGDWWCGNVDTIGAGLA